MIGTKIRGFRHLIRMAKTSSEVQIFFKHNYFHIGNGVALYVSIKEQANRYTMQNCDYIMIFNDVASNVRYNDSYHTSDGVGKRIKELRGIYSSLWVIPVEKRDFIEDANSLFQIVAVPSDFNEKYEKFCEANKKQMPNVTKHAGINCAFLKYLFVITNGSKNFFFWAANAYFKHNVTIYLLEKIMTWNDNYNQLSSKLKKGTITAYTNPREFLLLVNELSLLRRNKRANDVINMFNTAQKKALKAYSLNNRDYETLSKFGKLSGKKKSNFIRKMSTIEDPVEILKQMSFLADVHFEWKKESLLDFIKNSEGFNCEVVINSGDIVLLKVKDYETVKRLAKTTNWCISKDKKYWNEYVEHKHDATQYVLMDFSRKEDDNLSIVGFTSVHGKGITNAHDFQNKNLMQQRGRDSRKFSEIKSFVSKYVNCNSIFGILDKYGINMSDVVTYEPNQYEWNRESMFNYLHQCIDEEDYYIIYDDGDRVAFIAENNNIKYFLGDAYIENQRYDDFMHIEHIVFADFTKPQSDPEKLVYGVIIHNYDEHESACSRLYNDRFEVIAQSFDSKIKEYGLPYDIICRKGNIIDRFYNAFSSLELSTVKELINNPIIEKELKSKNRRAYIKDIIYDVTFSYKSADYINLFYDYGYTLSDVIGEKSVGEIAVNMLQNMLARENFVPSAEDIKNFYAEQAGTYDRALYINYFLMLLKMLDNEKSANFFARIVSVINDVHSVNDLFDLIFSMVANSINLEKDFSITKHIISYAFSNKRQRVINAINSNSSAGERTARMISSLYGENAVKTTEMWVKNADGIYVVESVNEEIAAHAPRRR